MRKGIIFLGLFLIGLFINLSYFVSAVECVDSDGGREYYIYGEVNASNFRDYCKGLVENKDCRQEETGIDECFIPPGGMHRGGAAMLKEWYCENNRMNGVTVVCQIGCENGACIRSEITNENCYDSDMGIRSQIKGTTTWNINGTNYTHMDYCFTESNNVELVSEGYCIMEKDTHSLSSIICEAGCEDGACKHSTVIQENVIYRFKVSIMNFFKKIFPAIQKKQLRQKELMNEKSDKQLFK